jgi:hypothetical protein
MHVLGIQISLLLVFFLESLHIGISNITGMKVGGSSAERNGVTLIATL